MISNDPNEPRPQTSNHSGAAGSSVPLDPRIPIEVVSSTSGATNDGSGTDPKPPGIDDLELHV